MVSVRRYLLLFALVVWGFSIATAQSVQKSHLELSFFTRALTSESTHEGLNHQLQEVSVCYENNKHHPRWDYKNNQATYDILVEAVKESYEYLCVEVESERTFLDVLDYLNTNSIALVGAVHDFTCPSSEKNYMYFPIRML